jgi:dihydrofolate synthase/folylpolyglutamate synthase
MNYNEALKWLFSQLPAYQKIGKKAYKADLSNIIKLTDYLGNPHTQFKSVHVGGTNGKGSSSHMLASILQEAGYKVGLYTSPHLKDFRERIRINGEMIPEAFVHNFILNHKSFFEENSLSFFEMTVGMAFDFF